MWGRNSAGVPVFDRLSASINRNLNQSVWETFLLISVLLFFVIANLLSQTSYLLLLLLIAECFILAAAQSTEVASAAQCHQDGKPSVRGRSGPELLTVYILSSDTVLHLDPASSTLSDIVLSDNIKTQSLMLATPFLGMQYLRELAPETGLGDLGFLGGDVTVVIGDHLVNDITVKMNDADDARSFIARVPLFCIPGVNLIWRWCIRHALVESMVPVNQAIAAFIVENRTVLDLLDSDTDLIRMWNGDAGPLVLLWEDSSSIS